MMTGTSRRKSNIVLVGFMGCGKTAVANVASRMTGRQMADTDDEIEKKADMTIPRIFEEYGEEYFRRLEAEVVRDVAARKNQVIATGGGVIKSEENMRCLQETGIIVYLHATAEKLYENTAHSNHRPLLNVPDRMARIRSILAERDPLYQRYADISIETSELGVMEVAKAMVRMIT